MYLKQVLKSQGFTRNFTFITFFFYTVFGWMDGWIAFVLRLLGLGLNFFLYL